MQARQDLAQAKSAVARHLNLPDPEVEYEDVVPTLRTPRELDYYLATAQKQQPQLQMSNLSAGVSRAAAGAAIWETFPKISAVASQDWNDDGLMTTPDRTTSGGFVMEWNFWDWGSTINKARAARFQAKQSAHNANATQNDILLAIEKAWRDDTMAHQMVEVQKNSLVNAEENFRIEQNRYNVGKTTTTDLLSAQTQLTSAETGYNGALYGAAVADASLQFIIGNKPFPEIMGGPANE
jgi:outer membrane protein TolC